MGLDITAYENSKFVSHFEYDENGDLTGEDWDNRHVVRFHECPSYETRTEGLSEGVYDDGVDQLGFRAGSYIGYSKWREQLAEIADYKPLYDIKVDTGDFINDAITNGFYKLHPHTAGTWHSSGGPFYEQIFFADNGGVIGPIVSAKLLRDYEQHIEKAKDHDEQFFNLYNLWRRAFLMASNNGHVIFH